MRLEHFPLEQLTKELLDIIGRQVDLSTHKVFYFGSRVMGKGNDRSDVDVGILGPEKIPFSVMARIQDDVENIRTLYTIDVVDFNSVSDDFRSVALEKIEYINNPQTHEKT